MLEFFFLLCIIGAIIYYIIRFGFSSNSSSPMDFLNQKVIFGGKDLSQLNIQQAYNELMRYANMPEPLTHWGRERKQAQIYYYIDKINSLKALGLDIEQFNADILTHEDRLNHLVAEERHNLDMMNVNRQADIQFSKYNSILDDEEFKKAMREYAFEKKNKKIDLKEREAEIDKTYATSYSIRTGADVDRIKAQAHANVENAQSEREKALAEFIEKTLNFIDITKFDAKLQTYIISSVFNPGGNQFDDLSMSEEIRQATIKMKQQEANAKEQDAKKAKAHAEQEQAKAESMKEKQERDKNRRGQAR